MMNLKQFEEPPYLIITKQFKPSKDDKETYRK